MIKRSILVVLRPLFRKYTYTVRNGLAKGLRRRGGLGFLPRKLTDEEKFLLELDLYNQIVYDVGGWEGIFTLFFSRAVGQGGKVISFEPNPNNYSRIIENINLNNLKNVTVYPIGLGRDTRRTIMFFPSGVLGEGSIRKQVHFGKTEHRYESIEVELDSLDHFIALHRPPEPDLIKMDVEGAEFDVLCGMGRTIKANSPTLFIEIHNIQDCAGSVLEYLFDYDYEIYHVETGQLVTHQYIDIINSGHIYCTRVNKQ